jgi:D-cysteine desulfhydrase
MKICPSGRTRPWLFEAFPRLEPHLPWTPLVTAPTPVHALENLSTRLANDVWIKRDDKTSPYYGGNKPRKLEFILGNALSEGRKTLVTGGGIGTNHGLATAVFGQQLGFRVVLVLFDQPVTDQVRKNLLMCHAYGANMRYAGSPLKAMLYFFVVERLCRPGAYFIALGGSCALGTLGYVEAGLELAMQIENGHIPVPKRIFVPVGSRGTMAGLVLGLRLAGLPTRVIGVQVVPLAFASPKGVLGLARKSLELMRRYDSSVPNIKLSLSDVVVDRVHRGKGYGCPTTAGHKALKLLGEHEGITLDLTYTSKAFAALLDHVRAQPVKGPVLFWNTLSSADLSSAANPAKWTSLPREFHRFFRGELADHDAQNVLRPSYRSQPTLLMGD